MNNKTKSYSGRAGAVKRALIGLGCAWVCASFAGENDGYLPATGTIPLRFMAVPHLFTNVVVVAPMVEAAPAPKPAEAPKAVEFFGPPAPHADAITNEVVSGTFQPTQPEEVVSPQMLMQYLHRSTNGTVTSVAAPMEFNPPIKAVEADTGGSKASYTTGQ